MRRAAKPVNGLRRPSRVMSARSVSLRTLDLVDEPQHAGTVRIEHTLRPFAVVMAGADVLDPFKD